VELTILRWALFAVLVAAPSFGQSRETFCGEIVLHNGRIATMDARDTMASSIVIRGERIAAVATTQGISPHSACATVIDVGGRRVIPGMIDTHDHPSYFTARPGYYTVLDTAASIADIEAKIRARAASVAAGEWVTSLGGWSLAQIAEKRMPTAAELDAATSTHPVLLVLAGSGAANSLGRG
jgi:predicted amidohydrolase YtcJ